MFVCMSVLSHLSFLCRLAPFLILHAHITHLPPSRRCPGNAAHCGACVFVCVCWLSRVFYGVAKAVCKFGCLVAIASASLPLPLPTPSSLLLPLRRRFAFAVRLAVARLLFTVWSAPAFLARSRSCVSPVFFVFFVFRLFLLCFS